MNFVYVENMVWVQLVESKRKSVEESGTLDISPAFDRQDYKFLKKAKKTLLIFKKLQKKQQL